MTALAMGLALVPLVVAVGGRIDATSGCRVRGISTSSRRCSALLIAPLDEQLSFLKIIRALSHAGQGCLPGDGPA